MSRVYLTFQRLVSPFTPKELTDPETPSIYRALSTTSIAVVKPRQRNTLRDPVGCNKYWPEEQEWRDGKLVNNTSKQVTPVEARGSPVKATNEPKIICTDSAVSVESGETANSGDVSTPVREAKTSGITGASKRPFEGGIKKGSAGVQAKKPQGASGANLPSRYMKFFSPSAGGDEPTPTNERAVSADPLGESSERGEQQTPSAFPPPHLVASSQSSSHTDALPANSPVESQDGIDDYGIEGDAAQPFGISNAVPDGLLSPPCDDQQKSLTQLIFDCGEPQYVQNACHDLQPIQGAGSDKLSQPDEEAGHDKHHQFSQKLGYVGQPVYSAEPPTGENILDHGFTTYQECFDDEEFARRIQAEEEAAAKAEAEERRRRMLEDERVAAELFNATNSGALGNTASLSSLPPLGTSLAASNLDSRLELADMTNFRETFGVPFALESDDNSYEDFLLAQKIQQEEMLLLEEEKRRLERDTKLAQELDQGGVCHALSTTNSQQLPSAPQLTTVKAVDRFSDDQEEEYLDPSRFFAESEEATLREIQRLREEEFLDANEPPGYDEDELYALQLQLEMEEEIRRHAEEVASLRLAEELQGQLQGSNVMRYDDYNPYSGMAAKLHSMYPKSTLTECFDALERANFDETRAAELLGNFPKLPGTSHRILFETDNKYSVDATVQSLTAKYGSHIPSLAIRQAAEQAEGHPDNTETILFSKFPNQMTMLNMHAKSSFAATKASAADQRTEWKTGSAGLGGGIKITRANGISLASSPQKLSRSKYSTNTVEEALEEAIADVDSEYMALTMRAYTSDDLIRACKRFGTQTQPSGNYASVRVTRENQLLYDSLRSNVETLREKYVKATKMVAAANKQGWAPVAQDWRAKADDLKQKMMAASLEAADCLFVQKNPSLVARLASDGYRRPDDLLDIDLHMLHVSEAEERVIALLALASIKGWRNIKIITGRGLHSSGEAKIFPRIGSVLRNNRTVVQSFQEGPGCYTVKVKSSVPLFSDGTA